MGVLARWAGVVLGVLLAAATARAQDDPPARVGRIAALQGEVYVFETEPRDWTAAARNRPFTQGERLATAAGASAELQVGSSTLLLAGDTEIEATRLDDERLQFALLRGSVALRLQAAELASELELFTPEARFVPLHVGLYRIDRFADGSSGSNWRGLLRATTRDVELTVEPGRSLQILPDGSGVLQLRWSQPATDAFATAFLRQAERADAAPEFVSSEMTGVAELERHGSWAQHPEFGWAWSPTVVAAQWAPYRFGHWAWLHPWGWTWVDDAPWGFAPFHYGRWFWWRSRWCWTPGPPRPRPVFAPALVGWGGGPSGVIVGGRPAPGLGWVPLGPREAYRPGYRASPGYVSRLNPHGPPGAAPPVFVNRRVPGAVTVWPGTALTPGRPVGANAWHADDATQRRLWQEGPARHAPERPLPPPSAGTPGASPRSSGGTHPPTAAVAPTGPFHGRPVGAAPPGAPREPLPRQPRPPVEVIPPAATATPQAAAPAAAAEHKPAAAAPGPSVREPPPRQARPLVEATPPAATTAMPQAAVPGPSLREPPPRQARPPVEVMPPAATATPQAATPAERKPAAATPAERKPAAAAPGPFMREAPPRQARPPVEAAPPAAPATPQAAAPAERKPAAAAPGPFMREAPPRQARPPVEAAPPAAATMPQAAAPSPSLREPPPRQLRPPLEATPSAAAATPRAAAPAERKPAADAPGPSMRNNDAAGARPVSERGRPPDARSTGRER